MLKECLCTAPWRLGGPFIAPKGLGVVGARFGRPWLPFVRECTRLSGAPDTARCNGYITSDWLLSTSGGNRTARWVAPDCPVHQLTIGSGRRVNSPLVGWHNRLFSTPCGLSDDL
jgi:hypothetical protein